MRMAPGEDDLMRFISTTTRWWVVVELLYCLLPRREQKSRVATCTLMWNVFPGLLSSVAALVEMR